MGSACHAGGVIDDKLLEQTRSNALGKEVAYSKGAIGDQIIEGSDFDNFKKSDWSDLLQRNIRKKPSNFPGVKEVSGNLVIVDKELYMQKIADVYSSTSTPLNERTRKLIENSINNNDSYPLINGLPGMHAEVRTYNDITTKYPNVVDSDISIATVRGGEATEGSRTVGSDFPACTNCSGILPSSVNIPTGRVVNSDSLYRKE